MTSDLTTHNASKSRRFSGKLVLGLIGLLLAVTFAFELRWNHETERLSVQTCFRNAEGLNEGAPVIMANTAAGFVQKVSSQPAEPQCPVKVDILLNVKISTRIPTDSTVGLQRDSSMGDTEAVIHLGSAEAPELVAGGSLKGEN